MNFLDEEELNSPLFHQWRFYLVITILLFIVSGLIFRSLDLTVIKQTFLKGQGDAREKRIVYTPAFRGLISDRNGRPLAISVPVFSLWANPREVNISQAQLNQLSVMLSMPATVIKKEIENAKNKNREFVYLKRSLSTELTDQIRLLNIPGMYFQQNYKRFYPEADVVSQVIGMTNVDDRGQEGLELAYNDWLSGQAEKKVVMKDRLGRTISTMQILQKQNAGNHLTTSLDNRIQYVAYRELANGIVQNKAASGSVVVLDVTTGEILAMVNQPSFDPNHFKKINPEALRNRAVTDVFEPGSTIKAFSIASALASGKYTMDSIINTYPGWIRVGKNIVRDEHTKEPLTVTQILQLSSNVGVTKIILSLPQHQLWDLLHEVGFGQSTGSDFPGEREGVLMKPAPNNPFALATLAFGYGISVTTLQLAEAYAILANEGVKLPVTFIKLDQAPPGKRVMDKNIAHEMLTLLEKVVEKGGTGEDASVPGYHIAGKTGTARKVGQHGYEKSHHVSSFVGIAPVSHPRLVVAVVIHDPQGKEYYGGKVSGPVFEKIMESALRILNIPPDDKSAYEVTKAPA